MELFFVNQWEENKNELEKYFLNNEVNYSYKKMVELLFTLVITKFDKEGDGFKCENITVVDDGDYQGCQIFIIPVNTYQPDINDYVFTSCYYGSCSGCDTMMDICENYDNRPKSEQVSKLMTLCLHLVQNTKYLNGAV